MVRLALIFEDEDPNMGVYFAACADNVKAAITGHVTELHEINGENLTIDHIDLTIEKFNGDKFICLVYSHGSKTSFGNQNEFIVKGGTKKFNKSFFYTFSCHTGGEVGEDLIESGCVAFWGYTSEASFVVGYLPVFVECANSGFVRMLEGLSSLDAFQAMKRTYTDHIDGIYPTDFFTASVLMSNRDGMILRGNEITFEQFLVSD